MSNRFAAVTNIRWPIALLGIVLLLVASAFGAIEAARLSLESNYRKAVELAAMQRAMEITMLTMNGNVMGAVATLGLVNHPIKKDALDLTPAQFPAVMEALEASGKMHQANGIFVVGTNGIVRSSWSSVDKPTTGLNLKFRSYIQSAMQGKQNVYAAVSMASGKRALFFAAPLYSEVSADSLVISATVARMGSEHRIGAENLAWVGTVALLAQSHFRQQP